MWDKKQKFGFLSESQHIGGIEWRSIQPDARHTWLTEGLHAGFDTFIPMGTKVAKAEKGEATDVIFKTYSNGVKTNRDAWVYNFNRNTLAENINRMIEIYNSEVARWMQRTDRDANLDDFVISDDAKIKWSSTLKQKLQSGQIAAFTDAKIRQSLYYPFIKSHLYFDRIMNDRVLAFPSIFPTLVAESENRVMIVSDHGFRAGFNTLMTKLIPDVHTLSASDSFQCFAFYTYDEDGTNRRENITDWALAEFRTHYTDNTITKWDIFHYNYGLLHHPDVSREIRGEPQTRSATYPLRQGFLGIRKSRRATR